MESAALQAEVDINSFWYHEGKCYSWNGGLKDGVKTVEAEYLNTINALTKHIQWQKTVGDYELWICMNEWSCLWWHMLQECIRFRVFYRTVYKEQLRCKNDEQSENRIVEAGNGFDKSCLIWCLKKSSKNWDMWNVCKEAEGNSLIENFSLSKSCNRDFHEEFKTAGACFYFKSSQ